MRTGDKEQPTDPGKSRQLLAALIVNVSTLSYGTMVGWQSPMAPQLQSSNSPLGTQPMTDGATSWLGGIMCLSGTIMTLFVGVITEKFGRKLIGCFAAIPLALSYILIFFATDEMQVFIARFLSGLGGGVVLFLIPLYVSEISCDRIRGMLGSLLVLTLNGGILLAYILGAVLSFRVFAITLLPLPLFYLGAFLFMPESPVYLVRRNRLHEATRSLMWFRGGHKMTVDRDISRIQAELKEINATARSVRYTDLFRDRGTIKGLIITIGLFGGQQFCGIFAVISYSTTIFEISGSSLSPHVSAIIIGLIQVVGSYLSTSLIERAGRKPLLLISCLGMGICTFTIGTYCYLQVLEYDTSSFSWLPVLALSVFVIIYCLGMGPGPYVVTSEVFSRDISSLGTTVGLIFVWSMAFVVVMFFPILLNLLGMHGCFFLFGTCCLVSFLFILILVPETKGRPRQDILNELNGVPYVMDEKRYVSTKSTDDNSLQSPEQV